MNPGELGGLLKGEVFFDDETLEEVSTDFGRLVKHRPEAVIVPAVVEDVEKVLLWAGRHGRRVGLRGSAGSQGGQTLHDDGLLMDLSNLNRIGEIEGDGVWVQAGTLWSELLRRTLGKGLLPSVFPDYLEVSVGGTLAAGATGAASHRFGPITEQVFELEVVTGEGHRVTCSRFQNRELFAAGLGGLGQCAVIVAARLPLRRAQPQVTTRILLYHDLEALARDMLEVCRSEEWDYLESWAVPCPVGDRRVGQVRMPVAEWLYPLHLSKEETNAEAAPSVADSLRPWRRLHEERRSLEEFLFRRETTVLQWRHSSAWNLPHPWVDALIPWDGAVAFAGGVLRGLPPHLFSQGEVILRPCRGLRSTPTLFSLPEGDPVLHLGLHPAVPRPLLPLALSLLRKSSDLVLKTGGKRVLSGWLDFDAPRWKSHFGEAWPRLEKWKDFFDPRTTLHPGDIPYRKIVTREV